MGHRPTSIRASHLIPHPPPPPPSQEASTTWGKIHWGHKPTSQLPYTSQARVIIHPKGDRHVPQGPYTEGYTRGPKSTPLAASWRGGGGHRPRPHGSSQKYPGSQKSDKSLFIHISVVTNLQVPGVMTPESSHNITPSSYSSGPGDFTTNILIWINIDMINIDICIYY